MDSSQEVDLEIAAREWAQRSDATLIGQHWDTCEDRDVAAFAKWFVETMTEVLGICLEKERGEGMEIVFTSETGEEFVVELGDASE